MPYRDGIALKSLIQRLLLTSLPLVAAVFFLIAGPARSLPFEDAAILFRYADNLAAGHGFRWNIHEAPADGATDLTFTFGIAVLHALGIELKAASLLLNLLALGGILWIFSGNFIRLRMSRIWLIFYLPSLTAGIWLIHAWAGFGTMFFAFWLLFCWQQAYLILQAGNRNSMWLFPVAAFLAGMARPEGFIFACLVAGMVFFALARTVKKDFLLSFIPVFGILCLAFMAWRISYFEHLFPVPFLRRTGGLLHPDHLKASFINLLVMGWAPLFILFTGTIGGTKKSWCRRNFFWIAGGFWLMWVLVENEVNYFGRYQFPVIPVLIVATLPFLHSLNPKLRQKWMFASGLLIMMMLPQVLFVMKNESLLMRKDDPADGRYEAAFILADAGDAEKRLLTTEAGLLPLYSGWTVLDAGGLNDRRVATEGLTSSYIADFHPDVIMLHGAARQSVEDDPVNRLLFSYAEKEKMLKFAFCEHEKDCHVYWVRDGQAYTRPIADGLGKLRYWRPWFRKYAELRPN